MGWCQVGVTRGLSYVVAGARKHGVRLAAISSLVLAAGLTGPAASAVAGARTSAGGTGTAGRAGSVGWGGAEAVPGLAALNAPGGTAGLNAISCASAGNCGAGGFYQYGTQCCDYQAFVVSQVNGQWGKAETVPGIASLNQSGDAQVTTVSCASPGNCAAGGFYGTERSGGGAELTAAFVVNQVNGVWGTALPVTGIPAKALRSGVGVLSCARPGKHNCTGGGTFAFTNRFGYRTTGFLISETGGVWHAAQVVAVTGGISGLSCASAGNCSAIGSVTCANSGDCPSGNYFINQVNGTWSKPVLAKDSLGKAASFGMVSCAVPGNCGAGGDARNGVVVASQVRGRWRAAERLPGAASLERGGESAFSSISCTSPGNCTAGGYGVRSIEQGSSTRTFAADFLATEKNGTWGAVHPVPGVAALSKFGYALVTAVSCSAPRNCAAGGAYSTSTYMPDPGSGPSQAFIASEINGTWHTARDVSTALGNAGPAQITAVSCPLVAQCSAVGAYWINYQEQLAFVISQVK
jgi:hypothetical protein